MRKIFKILLAVIIIAVVSLCINNVFADNRPEVIKYERNYDYSAVLYSDGQLYLWGYWDNENFNMELTDVKDYSGNNLYDVHLFIDSEHNLKMIQNNYIWNSEVSEGYYEYSTSEVIMTNAEKIVGEYVLTNDNKLYKYYFKNNEYNNIESFKYDLIFDDVKEWSYYNNSYLILDSNDTLYAYGLNVFGKKINDGNDIMEVPIEIATDVEMFSVNNLFYSTSYNSIDEKLDGNFYLTKDKELYIMSYDLPYPKKVMDGVERYLYKSYYVKDGKTYSANINISNDEVKFTSKLLLNEEMIDSSNGSGSTCFLVENNDLYCANGYDNNDNRIYEKIMNDVKQLGYSDDGNVLILDNDGNLFRRIRYMDENYREKFYLEKVISNVEKIYDNVGKTLIMEDDTIYIISNSDLRYDVGSFGGTDTINYKNYSIIKGLPNVPEELVPSQIVLNNGNKVDFSVGENYDFYAYIYPNNISDKDVIWESSDESIATVSDKGTLKFISPGKVTIKVRSKTLSSVSDEIEVIVHPKTSGIEILGDKEITVNTNEEKLLKVKVLPENTLEQKLVWTDDAGSSEGGYKIINFSNGWEEIQAKSYDEIVFYANQPGKYTITVTTEDGQYSDSITVNVIRGVTSLSPRPDTNSYLANTLYIYMKESNILDLNVRVYPEDAANKEVVYTSSDESIATVDVNGRVVAKKAGKVTITMKAKNYDVQETINILIFGNDVTTKIGDVDGDGIVDILDLVKLRRHVAGVEAIQ